MNFLSIFSMVSKKGGGGGGGAVNDVRVDNQSIVSNDIANTNTDTQAVDDLFVNIPKTDALTISDLLSNEDKSSEELTDNSQLSLTDLTNSKNKLFKLSQIWNWLKRKINTTITSSLTDDDLVSGKAVYDYIKQELIIVTGSLETSASRQKVYKITIGGQSFVSGYITFTFSGSFSKGWNGNVVTNLSISTLTGTRAFLSGTCSNFDLPIIVNWSGDVFRIGCPEAMTAREDRELCIQFSMIPIND